MIKLKSGWEKVEAGWYVKWILRGVRKVRMGVCKEVDGKWHSYVGNETGKTPGFATMVLAMGNAEKRA